MKYMGNKGKMLSVLGEIISDYSKNSEVVADPFCGSAAVSWFLAETLNKQIISGDIQSFAVARASAVIERTKHLDTERMLEVWFKKAKAIVNEVANHFPNHLRSIEPDFSHPEHIKTVVMQSRVFCKDVLPVVFKDFEGAWPISKAYGGHYYSPVQALIFDALRQSLPLRKEERQIAIASLIEAASKAAAAPGHTAQPFQPTNTSARYIIEAWLRDPWLLVSSSAHEMSRRKAKIQGKAFLGDFSNTISHLNPGDLVFADPPYSGVHYSRFYHVLETITRGVEFEPEGRGRYPSLKDRPSSSFSKKSESKIAANSLLKKCSEKRLRLVLTFPSKHSSNGLGAEDFIEIGRSLFSEIKIEEVNTDFSTLGGNKVHRAARQSSKESIISFLP